MAEQKTRDVRSSHDRVADEYARRISDELRYKPFDRQLLDRPWTGCPVCGVDLSHGMIEQACQLNRGIDFTQGDMLALDLADRTWAGITAFYVAGHTFLPEGR
jgi:trans-aconitate methyltransferase